MYIDDIIIFSRDKDEYLNYIDQVLSALKAFSISLFIKKCHFSYLSVDLLGHHVSRLKYSTLAEKVKAIRKKAFSKTLKKLKVKIGLFSYY